ncbi:hypothetical protein CHLNCDRAFT_140758 [Chlorella variabilis]|uniref:Uncharacterized protein n=1 Tax=Chlorella variabilis TaxID=554065 RepID=E1Z651_CHLVA|nr:hypothetical protein CHLNCDRAFT_140758 [Chlorella variabilis]EFN58870.1 hypothetical protein CHLNCDRAFT_140758 [Chlorella variabilis]|eukprot:XP_005850972.1 hypothetical protein CHLNCDRAFT_140758 [Chlorella variabilis]
MLPAFLFSIYVGTFCWNNRVYKCANGSFRCHNGACVSKTTYPFLPGRYHRYACLNNHDFANGPDVKTCAPGTQCWGHGSSQWGDSPCLKKKHRGVCPLGNGGCINYSQYCENGEIYSCPSGLRCAGPARSPLSGAGHVVAPCVKKL